MGKKDRCAVFGCNNDRRFPDKYVVKDHTSFFGGKPEVRFWSCKDPRQFSTWTKLLSRKRFKVNKNTKVCSNHFQFGKPVDSHPHPTLFLKGYDRETEITRKRKAPMERLAVQPTGRKKKRSDNYKQRVETETSHILETPEREQNSTSEPSEDPDRILVEKVVIPVSDTVKQDPVKKTSALKQGEVADDCCREQKFVVGQEGPQVTKKATKTKSEFSIEKIKNSDNLMKLYTGCPNYQIFLFIFNKVKPKVRKLQYHKGKITSNNINTTKNYQNSPTKPGCRGKPGPCSELNTENQLLLTLMKVRLDLHVEDLSFRFGLCKASVSRIISTWIPFLGMELQPLIYWPTVEDTLSYTPICFVGNLKKVEGIIDCTEQRIATPSNAKMQYQTYSQYKSANTLKKLIVCTKSGSKSFISDAYGGPLLIVLSQKIVVYGVIEIW